MHSHSHIVNTVALPTGRGGEREETGSAGFKKIISTKIQNLNLPADCCCPEGVIHAHADGVGARKTAKGRVASQLVEQ